MPPDRWLDAPRPTCTESELPRLADALIAAAGAVAAGGGLFSFADDAARHDEFLDGVGMAVGSMGMLVGGIAAVGAITSASRGHAHNTACRQMLAVQAGVPMPVNLTQQGRTAQLPTTLAVSVLAILKERGAPEQTALLAETCADPGGAPACLEPARFLVASGDPFAIDAGCGLARYACAQGITPSCTLVDERCTPGQGPTPQTTLPSRSGGLRSNQRREERSGESASRSLPRGVTDGHPTPWGLLPAAVNAASCSEFRVWLQIDDSETVEESDEGDNIVPTESTFHNCANVAQFP